MRAYNEAIYRETGIENIACIIEQPTLESFEAIWHGGDDPNDLEVYNHLDDQFFVGADFLVAPIVAQHESSSPPTPPVRNVYLPAGSDWYAFKDNMMPLDALA